MTNTLTNINPDGRYSMSDTARIYQVDYTTLWRWIKAGKIAVSGRSELSGKPYISGSEIIRAFNANR